MGTAVRPDLAIGSCRHLGERQGGYVTGRDREFLDLAVSLVRIAAAMAGREVA